MKIRAEVNLHEHKPVMLLETLTALNIKPDGVYVDGTFGRGGHSQFILNKLNNQGRLLVVDLDIEAIYIANQLQQTDPRVSVFHGSFKQITEFCHKFNISKIDGVLLDLGVSSPQLNNQNRGFSFSNDGPLDMRMDYSKGISASEWLKVVEKNELIRVLREYGQERFAPKIAEAIIITRSSKPINTTFDLVEIIKKNCPAFYSRNKHPATRTFQAIRIFINQELLNLQEALPEIMNLLAINGRLVVISFHSLEDSIVKNFITKYSKDTLCTDYAVRKLPLIRSNLEHIKLKSLGKLKPSIEEVNNNRRARSAIMRVAEKCA